MENEESKISKAEYAAAGLGIMWILVGAIFAGLIVGGCKSIEVRRHAASVATYADTNGVTHAVCDAKGKPIILDGGWEVDYFQHWMWTKLDTLNATAGTGVALSLNGYESAVDTNLVALVKTSFDGAALLAAKIGAAIATSGGSVAADGVKSAISAAVQRYISRGGDVSKAAVSCADGKCTISDGSVCETCDALGNCASCSDK